MYCLRHVTTQVSQKICVSISHSPFNLQVGGVNSQNISQFLIKFRAMLARTNIMPFSIFYPETLCICSTHPQIRWELNSSLKPSCHLPTSIFPQGSPCNLEGLNSTTLKESHWPETQSQTNKDLFTHQITWMSPSWLFDTILLQFLKVLLSQQQALSASRKECHLSWASGGIGLGPVSPGGLHQERTGVCSKDNVLGMVSGRQRISSSAAF